MSDIRRRLDIGSKLVIVVTLALFIAALFFKGFGHDLLLEGGVFLVSVKLILMAYQNSVDSKVLSDRLEGMRTSLARVESLLESRRSSELSETLHGPHPSGPTGGCGDAS